MNRIDLIFGPIILGLLFLGCDNTKPETADRKVNAPVTEVQRIEQKVSDSLELNLELLGYISTYPEKIIILAFKEEQKLQVYTKEDTGVKLIKEYPFTGFSGVLGPKLKQYDLQKGFTRLSS